MPCLKIEHMEYTPYGELWVEDSDDSFDKIPFRFTAKELDEETNLYYMSARYQNPKTSRWMSLDPAGAGLINPMEKDKEGKLQPRKGYNIIESLNWYTYGNNNPVRYKDPTGLYNVATGEIEAGDTLSEIAVIVSKDTGLEVTADQLAEYNGIDDPDKIRAGDKIKNTVPPLIRNAEESKNNPLILGALPLMALDKLANDNPYVRVTSGTLEILGGVSSGGVLGGFLFYDGTVRITSGIAEIAGGKKPEIMNGGSILDQMVPGDSKFFETAVDLGTTFSSGTSGDPISFFYGVYDVSH